MTFLQPGGDLPPSVYWRRRAVALVVLTILIAAIVTMISALFGGNGNASPSPTAGATDAAVPTCNSKDIALTANTDHDSYAQGEMPKISMTITNTGGNACSFAFGSDKQKYVIMSGTDTIWDSTACQTDKQPYTATLDPGVAVDVPSITWSRTRSDNCDNGTPAVGGGASYQLSTFVGDVESADPKQFMLF
jgi:hypothetical protein